MPINLDFLDKKFQDLVAKGNFLQITKATQNLEAQSTFRLGTNSVRALTRVNSGEDILVFKNDSDGLLYAIAGRREESRVINQRTILSRHTRPFRNTPGILGLLETFVIRIENPKVDDIHVLDPHLFWGVKIKDIRIVGGELEFILRKEGETDKVVAKGGTVPKDWGLLAKVKVVSDEDALVCALLLEHKSDHKVGWEAIPFNSNETESGSYTIVSDLPYTATLLALEGVPNEFSYSLNPAVDSEISESSSVVATFTRVQEGESSFLGSLLIKRQGQERRILERLSFKFTSTGEDETEYLIDPYQHKAVRIEGVEGLSVPVGSIQILIKKDGEPDVALDLGEPISVTAPKGSRIVALLIEVAADEVVSGRILMRRLG